MKLVERSLKSLLDWEQNSTVTRSLREKRTTHDDYRECSLSGNMQRRKMNVIRSHKHEVFTESINKTALSANDDEKVIREDKTPTFSRGHNQLDQ